SVVVEVRQKEVIDGGDSLRHLPDQTEYDMQHPTRHIATHTDSRKVHERFRCGQVSKVIQQYKAREQRVDERVRRIENRPGPLLRLCLVPVDLVDRTGNCSRET